MSTQDEDTLRRYPVKVIFSDGNAKTYSPEFQTDEQYAEGWKRTLRRARAEAKKVICLCTGKGETPLSVHYVVATDNYHLSKYPDTGHHHAKDCLYHMQGEESEKNEPSGRRKIKLEIGIQRHDAVGSKRSEAAEPSGKKRGARKSDRPVKLIELLRTLWTAARLNVWSPSFQGKRNQELVHWFLLQQAEEIDISGIKLSSVMLVATSLPKSRTAEENRKKQHEAGAEMRRIIVVAPLAQYQAGMEERSNLPIAGFLGMPMLKMDEKAWEDLQKREADALEAWRAGTKIEAIIQADVPEKGDAAVLRVELMKISEQWVPI